RHWRGSPRRACPARRRAPPERRGPGAACRRSRAGQGSRHEVGVYMRETPASAPFSSGNHAMNPRTALVTGGTGGIGTAIVRYLARRGHRVATNSRDQAQAQAWHTRMAGEGIDVCMVPGDVADPGSARAMIDAVERACGPVDILVNNAGITRDTTFHKMDYQQWTEVVNTNLNACFNVTRPVIEGMRARRWGRIVQISSINGQKGQ